MYPDLWWDGVIDKGFHRAVAQLGKHIRGFCIVGTYVPVGEGVKSREQ